VLCHHVLRLASYQCRVPLQPDQKIPQICSLKGSQNSKMLPTQAAEDEEVTKRLEHVKALPKGQKKDYRAEMLKGYDPKYVEAAT